MKRAIVFVALAGLVLGGCRKRQPSPEILMVPSHAEAPEASAAPPAPSSALGVVTVAGVSFTPPSEWTAENPSSPMRAAQYSLPGRAGGGEASFVVYYFGKGQGGSAGENVERWQEQFSDPSGQKAPGRVETIRTNGLSVTTVTASGTYSSGVPMGGPSAPQPGFALWGAIVEAPDGNVFLKVTGPQKTVTAWTPELVSLLKTIRPASTSM